MITSANYVSGAVMKLDSNQLTYLDSAVFQSIVTSFSTNEYSSSSTYISASNSKSIVSYCSIYSGSSFRISHSIYKGRSVFSCDLRINNTIVLVACLLSGEGVVFTGDGCTAVVAVRCRR